MRGRKMKSRNNCMRWHSRRRRGRGRVSKRKTKFIENNMLSDIKTTSGNVETEMAFVMATIPKKDTRG